MLGIPLPRETGLQVGDAPFRHVKRFWPTATDEFCEEAKRPVTFGADQQINPMVVAAIVVPKRGNQPIAVIDAVCVRTERFPSVGVVLFDAKCQKSRDA